MSVKNHEPDTLRSSLQFGLSRTGGQLPPPPPQRNQTSRATALSAECGGPGDACIGAIARHYERNLAGTLVDGPSRQVIGDLLKERAHQFGHPAAYHYALRFQQVH